MEIAIVNGRDLERLIEDLKAIVNRDMAYNDVYTLRFAVESGMKYKVNEGCWSPPIGRMADAGGY